MSFSSDVKEELAGQSSTARHCQIAEAAAIFRMNGKILSGDKNDLCMQVRLEHKGAAEKMVRLLENGFGVKPVFHAKGGVCTVCVDDSDDVRKIMETMKLSEEQGYDRADFVSNIIVQNTCCKRAFLRGAFLAGGSISNPEKSYHLEIPCSSKEKAVQLQQIAASFQIEAKIVLRKKYHVVYIKEGDQIVEMLGVMEAARALMNLENVRILKEMRGSVNRQVNCETANINKTVSAAVEQINDILLIRDVLGLENLPESLEAVARARLDNPEGTLKELGEALVPPVGKSGVNHRLKKIKEMADSLRGKEERN